jgi:enterochelin esterase family protein
MGDSFGGNISALISYQYPDVFGLCGLHSAAFWPNNYEVYNMIISGDKKNIKYYSVWGKYESLYSNMRNFLAQMTSLGYEIDGKEFNEGHSWGLWRATTDLILEYFFPSNSVSVEELNIVNSFELLQNYPNPFNPMTSIEYKVISSEYVILKVYDLLGNEIAELVNERNEAGNYKVNFDGRHLSSGVYFYKLKVGKNSQVRKMILLK